MRITGIQVNAHHRDSSECASQGFKRVLESAKPVRTHDWINKLRLAQTKQKDSHDFSTTTVIFTPIGRSNSSDRSFAAACSIRHFARVTIRSCDGDCTCNVSIAVSTSFSFFHPSCTKMSSYGISYTSQHIHTPTWFRYWNAFSRTTSFTCSSWLRFVTTPGENIHRPSCAARSSSISSCVTPLPLSADSNKI